VLFLHNDPEKNDRQKTLPQDEENDTGLDPGSRNK